MLQLAAHRPACCVERLLLILLLALAAPAASAQPFQVTGTTPAAHSVNAALSSSVTVRFNQPVDPATAAGAKEWTGMRYIFITQPPRNTPAELVFMPASPYHAGEEVSVTIPASVRSSGGSGLPPVATQPHVFQFRAAAGGSSHQRVVVSGCCRPASLFTALSEGTLGDVDGDGDLDALAADPGSGQVSVLLNDGSGQLTPDASRAFPALTSISALRGADVDNDGDLDLFCCSATGHAVGLSRNDGTGHFGPLTAIGAAGSWLAPTDMCVGDMDGDGDLDLTVCDASANTVTTCLNLGSSGFPATAFVAIACAGGPVSVSCADFDNDGALDVVAACRDTGEAAILLWKLSMWTAGLRVALPAGSHPTGVTAGDLDNDGRCDFVVAGIAGGVVAGIVVAAVVAARQTSTGGFGLGPALHCGDNPQAVALADLDGDGDLDLLCPDASGSGVAVCRNGDFAARGTFSDGSLAGQRDAGSGPVFTGGYGVRRVCVGDLDGDGDVDALAVCTGSSELIRLQNQVPVQIVSVSPAPNALVSRSTSTVSLTCAVPLDAASMPTLGVHCVARGRYASLTATAVTTASQVQSWSWGSSFPGSFRAGTGAGGAGRTVGGDFLPPIVWRIDKRPDPSNGTLAAVGGQPLVLSANAVSCTADVNSDGLTDLVSVQRNGTGGWNVKVNRRTATSWAAPVTTTDPTIPAGYDPAFVRCADLDLDGTPDVVVVSVNGSSGDSRCDVYLCAASGTCTKRSADAIAGTVTDLTLADLDCDGYVEALMPTPGSRGINERGLKFTSMPVRFYPTSGSPHLAAVANSGHYPTEKLVYDQVVVAGSPPVVSIAPLGATGELYDGERIDNALPAATGQRLTLADINGDGVEDVLVPIPSANAFKIKLTVFDRTTPPRAGPTVSTGAGSAPTRISCADLDGDGDRDVVVLCPGNSTLWVGLNDGQGNFSGSTVAVGAVPVDCWLNDCDNDGLADLLVQCADNTVRFFECGPPSPLDLFISTVQTIPAGTYHNITILDGGDATCAAGSTVTCTGQMTVGSGGSLRGHVSFTGAGTLLVAAGATLYIDDAAGISADGSSGQYRTLVRWTGNSWCSKGCSVVYTGTTPQVTGNGLPSQVFELTCANPAGLTLSQHLMAAGKVSVSDLSVMISLPSAQLTLRATADSTASVVNEGSGVIQGPVRVQTYVPSHTVPGAYGYHQWSPPTSNATVADFGSSGVVPVVNAAINTSPTPTYERPFPTVQLYDQSRIATAVNNLGTFDKGWMSPVALTDPLVPGRGYTVNMPGTTTLTCTGPLNNGPLSVSLSRTSGPTAADGGWALVGNMYPSPLDWSLVTTAYRPGLDAGIYAFESSSQYGGRYLAYANGIGPLNPALAMGQGFWVRVSQGRTSGTLNLNNAHRTCGCGKASLQDIHRSSGSPRPQVRLALNGQGLSDAAYLYFQAGATPGPDAEYDATKLPNPNGLNLATLAPAGQPLAIDGRPALTATTLVPLQIGVPATGLYAFTAALTDFPAGSTVYLRDALLGTRTRLTAGMRYSFVMTTYNAPGRFALEVSAAGALASAAQLLDAGLSIFPNPARTTATLALPGVPNATQATIGLSDALGREVRHLRVPLPATGQQATLDLTGLAPGLYAVRVRVGNATALRRLVVE